MRIQATRDGRAGVYRAGSRVMGYEKKLHLSLPGRRYERWLVLSFSHRDAKSDPKFLCRCDCGTEKVRSGNAIRHGRSRSCGCFRNEVCAVLNALPDNAGEVNSVMANYITSARRRGHAWNVTRDTLASLIRMPCVYCGSPPTNRKTLSRCKKVLLYNGIDRVDNQRGYEPDNVVPCCRKCNYAKRDMAEADFLAWLDRVAAHRAGSAQACAA